MIVWDIHTIQLDVLLTLLKQGLPLLMGKIINLLDMNLKEQTELGLLLI